MQQPSAFERVRGDVEVLLGDDRKSRQHRVAVMAVVRDRVLPVRDLPPHLVGDELVLRLDRPVLVPRRVSAVDADDLLQKHDVGGQTAQPVAQLVDHHSPVELREALVDVVGGDGEAHGVSKSVRVQMLTGSGPAHAEAAW